MCRFLLAEIYLQYVVEKPSADALRRAIAEFPGPNSSYDQAYETMMMHINDQAGSQASLARRCLSLILHASRPLTVSELRHALAVGAGDSLSNPHDMPCIKTIVGACAGLVTFSGYKQQLNSEDDTDEPDAAAPVRLLHRTAYTYLTRTRKRWFPNGEEQITAACVAYLSLPCFSGGPCATFSELESRLRAWSLYHYSALQWGHHARAALSRSPVQSIFWQDYEFLTSRPHLEAACQVLFATGDQETDIRDFPHRMTGLHLAAYFGIASLISALCAKNTGRGDGGGREDEKSKAAILNARDSHGRTVVSWAAQRGHLEALHVVLKEGGTLIDLDSRERRGQTPLSLAAEHGHTAIVETLLASAADPNLKSVGGSTPLWYAVKRGDMAMARLLLSLGARPNEPGTQDLNDGKPHSPIWLAVEAGHDEMVRLLLAQPTIQLHREEVRHSLYSRTLLWLATNGRHYNIVEMLLSHASAKGASTAETMTETEDEDEKPLYVAAKLGDEHITRLLLRSGVDVNARSHSDEDTALHGAVQEGHNGVAALLLSQGSILPHVANRYGYTPVFWAVKWGRTEILPKLLSTMNDTPEHVRATTYPLLLHEAAKQGNLAAIELLLTLKGIDVDARGPKGRTALSIVVSPEWNPGEASHDRDHAGITRRLLESGLVDVNSRDDAGMTPLAHAAGYRDGSVLLRILLDHGTTELDTVDKTGGTPLSTAVEGPREKNVALLLQYGADPTLGTCMGNRRPLFYATDTKHLATLKALLSDERINPHQRNADGHTALCKVMENGWTAGVEAFLAKEGVDFNARCDHGLTPLHHGACGAGYGSVWEEGSAVASLLERGNLDINAQDSMGKTALHYATERGNPEIVAMLLVARDVGFNIRDATGRTALHYALRTMDRAVVSVLFEAGDGNPNVRDPDGRTLLAIAAYSGSPDVVDWALSLDGVVPDARDNTGRTPLSLAARGRDNAEVLRRLLRTEGVDPNAEDEDGWTPLFWATQAGGMGATVEVLLAEGARVDINHIDRLGRTPLALALECGNEAVTEMLRTAGGGPSDLGLQRDGRQSDTMAHASEDADKAEDMDQGGEPGSVPGPGHTVEIPLWNPFDKEGKRWMDPDWFRDGELEDLGFWRAAAMRFGEGHSRHPRRFKSRDAGVRGVQAGEGYGYDVWQAPEEVDEERLCEDCNGLDLDMLTSEDRHLTRKPIVLSRLAKVDKSWASRDCDFCRLLSTIAPRNMRTGDSAEWELCAYSSTATWLSRANKKAGWDLSNMLADTIILGLEYPGSEYFSPTHPPRSRFSGRSSPDYLLSNPSAILPLGFIGRVDSRSSLRSLQIHALQPDEIDFDRARSWIDCCAAHHGERCNPHHDSRQRIPYFRLIDCINRSVVDSLSGSDQFVALSYVWGPPAEQGGCEDHGRVGKAERVVEDAIRVTTALGYKYLWVDRHCVTQDNADVRQQQLLSMNKVYENAEITIVVAAGQDSSFGIPGVGVRSRLRQPSAQVHGHVLATVPREPCEVVRHSVWWSRGWTFQEGLLSRRLLVFTQYEVSYECQVMVARESIGLPTWVHRVAATKHPLHEHSRIFPRRSTTGHSGFVWSRIIEYTRRRLTHDFDILNAMLGIMRIFAEQEPPIYQLCGIPLTFDGDNRFGRETTQTPLERFARSLCWTLESPGSRREGFPSWSWTGWKGVVSRPQGYNISLQLGFPIEVSLVPQDQSLQTLSWGDFEALEADAIALLPQYCYLQITAITMPVRIYGGAYEGDWRAVLYNDADALAASLELCKDPAKYPQFARRLLEDEWVAVAIGYSFSGLGSAYDDDDPFTLLLLEDFGDRWERVGVIKTDNKQVPDTRKGGCVKRTLLVQ